MAKAIAASMRDASSGSHAAVERSDSSMRDDESEESDHELYEEEEENLMDLDDFRSPNSMQPAAQAHGVSSSMLDEQAQQLMGLTGLDDIEQAKQYLAMFDGDLNVAATSILDGAVTGGSGPVKDKGPMGAEFASLFESQYGLLHPVFFMEDYDTALRTAKTQGRLLFVYVYSDHELDASDHFCSSVLRMGKVSDVLDNNFIFYACRQQKSVYVLSELAQGYSEPIVHPFCAMVMPAIDAASGQGAFVEPKVLRRFNGIFSADELEAACTSEWQKYASRLRDQQAAFSVIQADRQLKEEQNLELKEAMLMDKMKADEANRQEEEQKLEEVIEASRKQAEEQSFETEIKKRQEKFAAVPEEPPQGQKPAAKLQVSLPDGTKLMRRFHGENRVEVLYDWIGGHESLINRDAGSSFELVMTYPRKVLTAMDETLKQADLCPQAAIIVNMLDENDALDSPEASP